MTATARVAHPAPRFPAVRRAALDTVQVNLGYRCNQACHHCHVDAGPLRRESMDAPTIDLVLEFAQRAGAREIDLTGGAPELNPHFRALVSRARAAGLAVVDRCNLTILGEPGQEDLADFLAAAGVRVVASLPCYSAANTDSQRGKGVFERSLAGIHQLNALGYAADDSGLVLDFVYNPIGPSLPPDPALLEADYRRELAAYGVRFNQLLTITNMPIKRFRHALERDGRLAEYHRLLVDNFAAANLEHVMCRRLVSIDWAGYVYDCDFNQMLGLPLGGRQRHVGEMLATDLDGAAVAVAEHCFGCTAGRGSSCGGALTG
ncbi:MAG: arsenosugar biosynthesis radical SAM protein ArsS [Gammaproteobacteria bacterium]|nr:arsenosugar biosynthesis radical SAM protein ArsS [Gammaproteobacteria bacterium]MCP5202317.1 arsenosugar biosynthesis radical SAM protein ArsS [Gammaproteobacteria bacterium]